MNPVRTFIEKISRGKTFKRKIRVNRSTLPLFVSPDAQLKYLKPGLGAFDADLIAVAEKYVTTSSCVWDVGANVGVFTFAAAGIASQGSVVAVEADIWLANLLRRTARLDDYSDRNISILPAAASESCSVATFLVAKRGRASNSLESAGGRSQMGGVREKQFVPTVTLDSLLDVFDAPDFIKIDVEGAEQMVLNGAPRILSECRPLIYVEVGSEAAEAVLSILKSAGYSVFDKDCKTLEHVGQFDNWLCFPSESETARARTN